MYLVTRAADTAGGMGRGAGRGARVTRRRERPYVSATSISERICPRADSERSRYPRSIEYTTKESFFIKR